MTRYERIAQCIEVMTEAREAQAIAPALIHVVGELDWYIELRRLLYSSGETVRGYNSVVGGIAQWQGHQLPTRPAQKDCRHEPPYPGLDTVLFSIADPSLTAHLPMASCPIEHPHRISECGEWQER